MSRAWSVKKLDPGAPLALNARRVVAVRTGEYYSWEPIVDDNDHTEELHQLRISAKRLRYSLELFRDVFGEDVLRSIERVRAVQAILGTFHDQDVRIALIHDELQRLELESKNVEEHDAANAELSSAATVADSARLASSGDVRLGLANLLQRQRLARESTLAEFRDLWTSLRAASMREDLVRLSSLPLVERDEETER